MQLLKYEIFTSSHQLEVKKINQKLKFLNPYIMQHDDVNL